MRRRRARESQAACRRFRRKIFPRSPYLASGLCATRAAGDNIFNSLFGAGPVEPAFLFQPIDSGRGLWKSAPNVTRRDAFSERVDFLSYFANLLGKFHRARRSFTQPERNAGSRTLASSTETEPDCTRRMRHEVFPRRMISPRRLSTAKSSSTVPTTRCSGSAMTV